MGNWPALYDRMLQTGIRTFGIPVTFIPLGMTGTPGTPVQISAAWDNATIEAMTSQGASVSSVHPVLTLRIADLPGATAPTTKDKFTVNGNNYRVVETRPDGQGAAQIILNKV